MNMVLVFRDTVTLLTAFARNLESVGIRTATLYSNQPETRALCALKDFADGGRARAGRDGYRRAALMWTEFRTS